MVAAWEGQTSVMKQLLKRGSARFPTPRVLLVAATPPARLTFVAEFCIVGLPRLWLARKRTT
jgi:hypothetical protein